MQQDVEDSYFDLGSALRQGDWLPFRSSDGQFPTLTLDTATTAIDTLTTIANSTTPTFIITPKTYRSIVTLYRKSLHRQRALLKKQRRTRAGTLRYASAMIRNVAERKKHH